MTREEYVDTLRAASFELAGLMGEWLTDDAEYVDDAVDDELGEIIGTLEDLIVKLKAAVS